MSPETILPQGCSLYRTYDRHKVPSSPEEPLPLDNTEISDTGMILYAQLRSGQLITESAMVNHVQDHPEVLALLPGIFERLYILQEHQILSPEKEDKLLAKGYILAREGKEGKGFSVEVPFPEVIGTTPVVPVTEEDWESGTAFLAYRVTPTGTRPIRSSFVTGREPSPSKHLTLIFYRIKEKDRNTEAEVRLGYPERAYGFNTAFVGRQARREPEAFKPEDRDTPEYHEAVTFWRTHAFVAEEGSFVTEK